MDEYVPQLGDMVAVKRFGYTHVGIYVGPRGPSGEEIVHNDKNGGVVLATRAAFSGNQPITLRKRVTNDYFRKQEIVSRAFFLIGRKFDLINFNCEHAANWIQSDRKESGQLQGAVFVGLALLGLALLSKGS